MSAGRESLSQPAGHGIGRREWEVRFAERIRSKISFDTPAVMQAVIAAELESWSEDEDHWLYDSPEHAADENLSYWEDDGE